MLHDGQTQGPRGWPNILGRLRATAFQALGKTGATAGCALAGGTISGAPISGAFDAGDVVPAQEGTLWICTAAGSPGTWAQIGATGATGAAGANFTVGSIAAARAYNSADLTISSATVTALTLDSQRFDQGTGSAQHSTSSNTSRLTCRQAGLYQVTGMFTWASTSNTGANRLLILRLNGSTEIARVNMPANSGGELLCATSLYSLALTDYVELCAYQDSGGTMSVVAIGNRSPELMWVLAG